MEYPKRETGQRWVMVDSFPSGKTEVIVEFTLGAFYVNPATFHTELWKLINCKNQVFDSAPEYWWTNPNAGHTLFLLCAKAH